jgi:DNA-binding transcriptional LysR family regulator
MDLLSAFRTFVRITETGSFSAVARELGATQPAISRQVAALESHLAVRLFQRSTRSLTLTEDGRDLLSHARVVIEAVEEAEAAIGRRRVSPSGLVRLGAPTVFGRTYIVPHLSALLERYPDITLELVTGDDVVDMIHDRLDVSIRVGEIDDPTLVARKVGSTVSLPVASAAYLAEHGEPLEPADLAGRECILFTRRDNPAEWSFSGPDGVVTVSVTGRFRTNSIEAVLAGVVAGRGIAMVPLWMVRAELSRGEVRPVLQQYRAAPRAIFAVYPSRRFLAPRTRAVVDFLVAEFRLDPVISPYGEPSPGTIPEMSPERSPEISIETSLAPATAESR